MSYTDDLTEEDIAKRKRRRMRKRNLLLQHMLGDGGAADITSGQAILTEASEYLIAENLDYLIQETGSYTIALSASTVAEDASVGTAIGTLSVTTSGTWTFAVWIDADGKFAVSGSTLQTNAALDYESATSHSVTIQATNSGTGEKINRTFTITVTDVAESNYDPDSELYFDAAAVAPDETRKGHIDDLVVALKAASVWDKLDFMYLFAAHEEQLSLVNLKDPGTFNASKVSTPTFTTDQGWAGNGSSTYLTTNFNPATAGGVFVQDSAHFGVWLRTNSAANVIDIGNMGASSANGYCKYSSNSTFCRINDSSDSSMGTPASSAGSFIFTRPNSSDKICYKDGSQQGQASVASNGVASANMFICAGNSGGSPSEMSTRQIAAAHAGSGLSATDASNLYDALHTYLVAVGAA